MSSARAKGQVKADVPRVFWSVREFAAATGCALDTIYRRMHRGELAWTWVGGEKRIPDSEMKRLVDEAMARKTG